MRKQGRFYRLVLFVILMALVASACDYTISFGPRGPGSTPAATATAESADLPLPPPRLLKRTPEPGEPQDLEGSVALTFDQSMDKASVEAAFIISPTVTGDFRWTEDARTLTFAPTQRLERGRRYHVKVEKTARNTEGEPVLDPITFDFWTVGFLAVSEVQPAPKSDDVDPDTVVTVVFNRPVVPLTSVDRQEELPQPLTFTPEVQGEGEWLNTSIYRFHPEESFQPATTYEVRVASTLSDTLGGTLEEEYVWTFTTLRPAVAGWSPRSNAEHVGPGAVISVTFNQPMDHASAEEAFSLSIGNEPLEGTFTWASDESSDLPEAIRPEIMAFKPAQPLPRTAVVNARVAGSARARSSDVTMSEGTRWQFKTVLEPGIISTSPTDGETDVSPYGDVRITFASPMETEDFMSYLRVTPSVTDVYTYWSQANTELHLSFRREPNSTYTLYLDGDAPDRYGAPLGENLRLRFTTGDLPPLASLNREGEIGTFNAYTDTLLFASHRNVSRLDVSLYSLDVDTFMKLHAYGDYEYRRDFYPDEEDLLRQWSVEVDAPRNQASLARLEITDDEGQQLPPGIYYVLLSAPEVLGRRGGGEDHFTLIRSRYNLTLKRGTTESLLWVTDLDSGEPVSDLDIRFHSEEAGWHAEGATGAEGLYLARDLQETDLWQSYFAFTGEPGAEAFGVAYSDWDWGIRPWNFDLNSQYDADDFRGYLYTDRPIYRPGQIVYFKGIVRADDDAHYTLPTELGDLGVSVTNPDGNVILTETLTLNEMGTFHGELTLDEEAALGTYYVRAQELDHDFYTSGSFRVAEYRKPEFQVSVTTDRDAYVNGDDINVTTQADYYFGGAVANAEVMWNVLSAEYYFRYRCPTGERCPNYSWQDFSWEDRREGDWYGGYGQLIAEGEASTDSEGRVTFDVAADISEETGSRRFTIEANVTDINNQVVSQRTAAIVHRGEFYIGLAPQGRLAEAGEEKTVDVITVDWESEPVPETSLQVLLLKRNWYSVREQAEDGRYYWNWELEEIPVYTTTVTTGTDGKARVQVTPPEMGSYKVLATGEDDRGNEIRSSTYLWAWGSGWVSWRRESTNRIELIPDRDEYAVGDVAEILIPSPYTGTVKALVTIERGHIMSTEVRELQSSSEVLRIPIEEAYAPNIFVSVVIVQGSGPAPDNLASFKMGAVKLPISTETKDLSITLTPGREMDEGEYYRPRETATYDIEVTDHEGQPVETELSLRLADLAVLALADESEPTLLERFWSERGLGIQTALPLAVAMEAYNRELAPKAKGGGGGEETGEGFIRTNFVDTAFWDPVVRTDEEGRAQVEVELPDNLTTWRMQARGITEETLVGRAEVDIRSTLDLLVRPVLPRFFVVGDEAEIATIVHNNTTTTLSIDVQITVEGLEVTGGTRQTVNLAGGDEAELIWPVTVSPLAAAGDAAGEIQVRMEARAGDYYDGREDTLPVYRHSTPEVMATAGRLSEPGLRQEIIQLPREFDPTQGELTVQLDGSLTAATQDALDYLEHYPYECVEQTVSRFLPNILTYQALKEMGLVRPELEEELTEQVNVALQRLYSRQHYDGGWGWWTSDHSSVYLTAYVLQGLVEAYRAGFGVDVKVMERAADYLRENFTSVNTLEQSWKANRLAYQLYVLAEYITTVEGADEKGELGLAVSLYVRRALLDRYGQAMLSVALGLLRPEEESRINTLLSDLSGDAVASATGIHWEEAEVDYWNMNTDVRTTAIVLWAMAKHRPDSDLLPNVVRWLMSIRKEGHWGTTQTTSWSLMALIEYMRATGELAGDFDYNVILNGEQLAEGSFSSENIDESRRLQVEIAQLLVDEGNRLIVQREEADSDQTGEGQLYYTAHLRYFLPVEELAALDRGIIIARQYSLVDSPDEFVEGAEVGDVIRVKLTVIAPSDLYYVVVEDPLPAGCEAIDQSLKTTSVVGERPSLHNVTAEEEDYWYRRYGWGWWWFSHTEMRDEKVALFATYLPRGTYEYTYVMRASLPGEFNVLPATAYEMYFPEVFGRSEGGQFTITNP